jgi:hypothetical protein
MNPKLKQCSDLSIVTSMRCLPLGALDPVLGQYGERSRSDLRYRGTSRMIALTGFGHAVGIQLESWMYISRSEPELDDDNMRGKAIVIG